MCEKDNKILLSCNIDNFVSILEFDIMNSRLKVAVGFELLGQTDDKIMTTCALDELLLDEPNFLRETESCFVIVFDKVVIVFFDMKMDLLPNMYINE